MGFKFRCRRTGKLNICFAVWLAGDKDRELPGCLDDPRCDDECDECDECDGGGLAGEDMGVPPVGVTSPATRRVSRVARV